jgi:hypothetical protein
MLDPASVFGTTAPAAAAAAPAGAEPTPVEAEPEPEPEPEDPEFVPVDMNEWEGTWGEDWEKGSPVRESETVVEEKANLQDITDERSEGDDSTTDD